MEQIISVPLQELSAFARNFSPSVLEELLTTSSMKPEERTAFREQYRDMQLTLERVLQAYGRYEAIDRPAIKECLEAYLFLLQRGPESREELIQQFAVVLDQAARIDVLDDGMMDLLKEIWPEVQWLEQLPAFEGGQLPDESVWPKYRLKEIFEGKNRQAQVFWNNSWVLVQLDIVSATEELKRGKKHLESLGKALDHCCNIIGLLSKIHTIIM
ncbi:MAG: hypothetical protein ACOYOE_04230 [Chlorobium sp.]